MRPTVSCLIDRHQAKDVTATAAAAAAAAATAAEISAMSCIAAVCTDKVNYHSSQSLISFNFKNRACIKIEILKILFC